MKQQSINILIVDQSGTHSSAIFELIKQHFDSEYQLTLETSIENAALNINSNMPDCILVSLLGDTELAYTPIKQLKIALQRKYLPLICLAESGNELVAARALHEGALDYLITDKIAPHIFSKMIRSVVERFQLMLELEKQSGDLANFIHNDALTGLANRMVFEQVLIHAVARAERYNRQMAILLLNIDGFDSINHQYGRECANELLQAVALRITANVRSCDAIARLYADEFGIVLDEIREFYDASVVAKRLIELMAKPFVVGTQTITLTASIGIACYPVAGITVAELRKSAANAMLGAKRNHGNCFNYYTDELNKESYQLLLIANALHNALRNHELFLCYQPIFDLKLRKPIALEALLRWQHPTIGTVYPNDFIYLAERSGLIVEIGSWVMAAACEDFMKLKALGFDLKKIYVNVSAKQIEDGFVACVKKVIQSSKIPAAAIGLELTETALANNLARAHQVMKQLQHTGVDIAIDDFGTGYFSLTFLKRLPFNSLKIDRSFVDGLGNDPIDEAIVVAVLSLVNNLGINVVAEGIETEEQLKFLEKQSCPQGQGYLFSKPLKMADLVPFLKQFLT